MVLLPFFEIPYGNRLAKNVRKQYVQVVPRSTISHTFLIATIVHAISTLVFRIIVQVGLKVLVGYLFIGSVVVLTLHCKEEVNELTLIVQHSLI